MAQTLHRECGRYCIQPGLEAFIKSYGPAAEEYFSVEELTMKVSFKNYETEKTEYVDGKWHLVYCNDIDKLSPCLEVKILFKNQFLFELP